MRALAVLSLAGPSTSCTRRHGMNLLALALYELSPALQAEVFLSFSVCSCVEVKDMTSCMRAAIEFEWW